MKPAKSITCFLAFWMLFFSCAAAKKNFLPRKYEIKNIERWIPESSKKSRDVRLCKNFMLTEKQIREYFKKANIEKAEGFDMAHDWLPCYIKGDIAWEGNTAEFKINAMQTAVITLSKGTTIYLYCGKPCDHMFLAEHMLEK